jgi:hypothetical protein
MLTSRRNPIIIPPGVDKDDNAYTTFQWTDADKIRFYRNYPQKIGGWQSVVYGNTQTLTGVPRNVWSFIDNTGVEHVLIGTNTGLYSYENGNLYNITPLVTATTAIANSLSTNYLNPLANNPVTTTINTKTITLAIGSGVATVSRMGDFVLVSGVAGAVGGIAAVDINGTFAISSVVGNNITYESPSATVATSTATGGGAAVVLATRVITVAQAAHGFVEGNRIKILAAAGFGGFVAGDLNIESIVRFIGVNSYAYYSITADTSGNFATSAAAAGGGAATTVQGQIADGTCAFSQALGYGGGLYGLGTYGTGKVFTGVPATPRIWSFAKYNDSIVLTPGNQSGIYLWACNVATAPVLQTAGSIPTAVNYVDVMDDQVVAFGAAGVVNNIKSTNDITNWDTTDPAVEAFSSNLLSYGRLLTREYCKGQNIIFSESSVHKMTFVGLPDIWMFEDIMTSDGLLGPQAADSVQDNVVWVGSSNFYIYNGSIVSVIPNNTLNQWFFTNLSNATFYHSFIHKSIDFNEVWWFAPFDGSEEPNNYVIWNWQEGHWTNGQLSRTASEELTDILIRDQFMAFGQCSPAINGILYRHESAGNYSDNGGNMSGSLTSNYSIIDTGEYMQEILRIIPSTALLPIGTVPAGSTLFNMFIYTKEYDGMPTARTFGPYPITDMTQKVETRANGRQRQYQFTFNNTTGFRFEKFFEELRTTTPR